MKGESSLFIHKRVIIPRRGAHGLLKEGAPSGVKGLPSVGERVPPLHTHQTSVNKSQTQGEGTTSFDCVLPPQEGATSPRGAHLSNLM
jgi:hypothetical protein